MDFMVGLPQTFKKHDSIWVIVDRLTKSTHFLPVKTTYTVPQYATLYIKEIVQLHGSPESIISDRGAQFTAQFWKSFQEGLGWFEIGETKLIGPDIVQDALRKVKLIQERLKIAQSRQRSYADIRRRDLEFKVGDYVFLKVSPMKGIMRFGRKGKFSPKYIGPSPILERNGRVAYRLALPPVLSSVHLIFHVSMLKKYFHDSSHVIDRQDIEFDDDTLSYEEVPIAIIDKQVRRLRTKDVALVKVIWSNHSAEEATWEPEEAMKKKYLYLFDIQVLRMQVTRHVARGDIPDLVYRLR
uniref:Integrase catalytic domain-containing protein n=1 Tax=Nicotiana tabacum TaxID=4097 RepID=A0A1S3XDR2_TOBAC|nr:PREDICTED: uncharacterized protein LOC107764080 [Nicotiana tabacum]